MDCINIHPVGNITQDVHCEHHTVKDLSTDRSHSQCHTFKIFVMTAFRFQVIHCVMHTYCCETNHSKVLWFHGLIGFHWIIFFWDFPCSWSQMLAEAGVVWKFDWTRCPRWPVACLLVDSGYCSGLQLKLSNRVAILGLSMWLGFFTSWWLVSDRDHPKNKSSQRPKLKLWGFLWHSLGGIFWHILLVKQFTNDNPGSKKRELDSALIRVCQRICGHF